MQLQSPISNDIDEDYYPPITTSEVAEVPAVSLDHQTGEVEVLSKIIPLADRKFNQDCRSCNTQLSFTVKHIYKTYKTWKAWITSLPDEFEIKCPVCYGNVSVTRCLPDWIKKRT
jgi:hypothetical protein